MLISYQTKYKQNNEILYHVIIYLTKIKLSQNVEEVCEKLSMPILLP